MRAAFLVLLLTSASVAASVPVTDPIAAALTRARAEAAAADREARRLGVLAGKQRDEAQKLRLRQEAAVSALAAAEAEISAADGEARLLSQRLEQQRRALRQQQAPASALLGGLAMMAQRPPLLAIADQGGVDEFVRVKLLLDSTMPVIRQRTAGLSAAVQRSRTLSVRLEQARLAMATRRADLADRQQDLARLEQEAVRFAERTGFAALSSADVALSRGEAGERLEGEQARARSAGRVAADVAQLGEPPVRPFAAEGAAQPALAYSLPANSPVVDGFGSVSDSGIRSRGITMATGRGTALTSPADGTILFAGPYRSHDGIIIIDHGNGWKSLLLNASTDLAKGSKVKSGEPLGRALGPISLELSRNGHHHSPALIAGSSRKLSISGKSG